MSTTPDHFPTDVEGLPEAHAPERVELSDGDEFNLRIGPVAKRIGDDTVRMLAYNGSIPGPVLEVQEGSEIVVNIENQGDVEATVHWHGLRLENRYDGTHETQTPVEVGERYSARVTFPDPGAYWYHPHIREDYGQELGLYGNCLVVPSDPDYWPPANRDIPLTLDDILLEDGKVAPFSRSETTYVAMGRFGEVLLVNGETDLSLDARLGEVVRLYFTNTANTRTFKVALPGARMKLVGGDSGHVEHEEFVEDVVLAPSERVVVDVLFDKPGDLTLEHRTPERVYPLAAIHVSDERIEPSYADAVRSPPHERRHGRRARADRFLFRRRAGQDARVHRRDGHGGARRPGRLRLPDAPRGGQRRAGQLPEVRDEAVGGRRAERRLRVPDASGGRERRARPLPEVPDEAGAGGARRRRRGAATDTRQHEHEGTSTTTPRPAASSGKTTWST